MTGRFSPFRKEECSVIFAAMSALPWICALQFYAALGSLEGSEPIHEGEPPAVRGDAPSGLFTPRWAELRQTYGIERSQGRRSEIYVHRLPHSQYGILSMPTWNRVVVTHDLWPDELVDDITVNFDDLRDQWPEVEWSLAGYQFHQMHLMTSDVIQPDPGFSRFSWLDYLLGH